MRARKIKRKDAPILIRNKEGEKRTVEGEILSVCFAVHRSYYGGGWTLTHTPSGTAFVANLRTKKIAIELWEKTRKLMREARRSG